MEKENKKSLTVISFISGKGGSGKTTASLAIAKILADVGLKILLVDFDLATNGASYFFSPKLSETDGEGLAEILEDFHNDLKTNSTKFEDLLERLIVPLSQNFDFIPARSDFGKPFSGGPEVSNKEFLVKVILKPLIKKLGYSYDYILIDNQAGYTNTSAAAASIADKAIVVSESDQISSDAVDNLIALLGSDMPRFRRYLINKVEIKEAGDYRAKVKAFKDMNRLPPLPFDFSVRNAFGEREIPIDLEVPTSFLMALFATVKEILPEKKELLDKYETEKVTSLFDTYQRKLDDLLERRNNIREQLIEFETIEKRKQSDQKIFISRLLTMMVMAATTTIGFITFFEVFDIVDRIRDLYLMAGGVSLILGVYIVSLLLSRSRQLTDTAELEENRSRNNLRLQREIGEIESKVDQYNNLIATRSRDLLIDFDKF